MCKEIGVDPLSCKHMLSLTHSIANKGFWVDVLGVGDFYYELAVTNTLNSSLDPDSQHLHRPQEEERRLP